MKQMASDGWNYGDILDVNGAVIAPETDALVAGDTHLSWHTLTERSNRLARFFHANGLVEGDKFAFYLYNSPAYIEALAGVFKARLVHVNVNYRYRADELIYLLDNADAACVLYDARFREMIAPLRARLPKVKLFIEAGGENTPSWAHEYETLAREGSAAPLDITRSGDDLFFIYTGGTTGMPKGVMWRGDDMRRVQLGGRPHTTEELNPSPEAQEKLVRQDKGHAAKRMMIPTPIMHGTGFILATAVMSDGGTIYFPHQTDHFDADDILDMIEAHKISSLVIVGDAMARPLVHAGEARKRDLSAMRFIITTGVMCAHETKLRLLELMPEAIIADTLGASEGVGMGSSITARGRDGAQTAQFRLNDKALVITEEGKPVPPGGGIGLLARKTLIPLGYYKDAKKTEEIFRTINGTRYAVPGDYAEHLSDGTLRLLGRASQCINTGGEKVFAEEVEEALKRHAAVEDACVVGVKDARWGQAVGALVQLTKGEETNAEALRAWLKERIADYKVPKTLLIRETLARAPNGKADYKSIRELVSDAHTQKGEKQSSPAQ